MEIIVCKPIIAWWAKRTRKGKREKGFISIYCRICTIRFSLISPHLYLSRKPSPFARGANSWCPTILNSGLYHCPQPPNEFPSFLSTCLEQFYPVFFLIFNIALFDWGRSGLWKPQTLSTSRSIWRNWWQILGHMTEFIHTLILGSNPHRCWLLSIPTDITGLKAEVFSQFLLTQHLTEICRKEWGPVYLTLIY